MWQITHIRHPNNSFFCFIHINHNYTESLLISQVFKDPIKHDTIILNLNPKQFNGLGKRFFYILQKCMIRGSYFWIPMNALTLFFSYRNWYYGSFCFTIEEDMTQFHKEDTELLYNRPGYEVRLGLSKMQKHKGHSLYIMSSCKDQSSILHYIFYLHRESSKELHTWHSL